MAFNYTVVRLDRMSGTTDGSLLRSIRYQESSTDAAVENGRVVALEGLMTGEREIYKAGLPASTTKMEDIVLVASPEYLVDERLKALTDFRNEAGDIARAFKFHSGDCFSATAGAFDTTPTVGQLVEVKASQNTMHVVSTATAGAIVIGRVSAIETVGSLTYYVVDVLLYAEPAASGVGG